MNPPLFIDGSARPDGNTAALVASIRDRLPASIAVPLAPLSIAPFEYGRSVDDDFHAIVAAMLATDDIVFATPVYWYAMSGRMKTLFDRLTDLLHHAELKPKGRALAGRRGWLVAVGTDPELPPGFEEPFRRTCRYFAMNWGASVYVNSRGEDWMARSGEAVDDWIAKLGEARGGV